MNFGRRGLLQAVLLAGLGQHVAGIANHDMLMRSEKRSPDVEQETQKGVQIDAHAGIISTEQNDVQIGTQKDVQNDADPESLSESMFGEKTQGFSAKANQSDSVGSCNSENNPAESRRSYSSIWSGQAAGVGHGRSMLGSPQAWSAQHNQAHEWMIIDLGSEKIVGGAVTQGRSDCDQRVKRYDVATSTSGVNGPWTAGHSGCVGNSDRHTKVNCNFDPRKARYVKFANFQWNSHLSMRAGVLTCSSFTCTCENGAGATGSSCTSHNAHICQSCSSGYQLTSDKRCIIPDCTCDNGEAATGNDCTTHNAHKCSSCDSGYALSSDTCSKASCPTDSTGDDVLAGCTCDAGFAGTISAAVNSEGYDGSCTANTCTCTDGTAATGADCTTDGDAVCSECDTGFTLKTEDNTCVAAAPAEKSSAEQARIWLAPLILLVPKLL